jgi:hypothetical protein
VSVFHSFHSKKEGQERIEEAKTCLLMRQFDWLVKVYKVTTTFVRHEVTQTYFESSSGQCYQGNQSVE